MKLGVFDRLVLLSVLPREGDLVSLRVVRDLQSVLSFTEAEHKKLQFFEKDGQTHWVREADKSVNVEFGEKAREIILGRFKELDEQKKLLVDHLPIYERFLELADEPAALRAVEG